MKQFPHMEQQETYLSSIALSSLRSTDIKIPKCCAETKPRRKIAPFATPTRRRLSQFEIISPSFIVNANFEVNYKVFRDFAAAAQCLPKGQDEPQAQEGSSPSHMMRLCASCK
ncbi:conserved hypothetical protein [Aspergillus fumigatus A1163]|uniref:Uncharacterized protein n=1 Tax=Aspergillus fumigatus (strain CBS 144.89 / FGSC A1163 / CEA10) TaxID=451804 RepID=B0XXG8_ASPFC|nr:conserved hypothetical protein [Aspergillus fumigatus A1163]